MLDTIRIFGASRCMVASNWPADSLAADSLDTVMDGFRTICAHLPAAERAMVYRDTARRVYRLDAAVDAA